MSLIFTLLILTMSVRSQDMRGELFVYPTSFSGSESDTNVVWMLTDRGALYTAPSMRDEWTFVSRVQVPWYSDILGSRSRKGAIEFVAVTDSLLVVLQREGYDELEAMRMTLLRSRDRGRTWEKIRLPHDTIAVSVTSDTKGRIWVACTNGDLIHSSDMGWSWTVLRSSPPDSGLMSSIMMLDSLKGVALTTHNMVAITADNWKTSRLMPAPKAYIPSVYYTRLNTFHIPEVLLLNDVVYVTRPDQICYCSASDTVWHRLTPTIFQLSFDRANRRAIGITEEGAILALHSPREYDTLATHNFIRVLDPVIIDGQDVAVLIDNTLWHVANGHLTKVVMLSAENKAATPRQVMKVQGGYVGFGYDCVYFSHSGSDSTWQRIVTLQEDMWKPRLVNDSTIVMNSWIGHQQINLRTWQVSAYTHRLPITSFLNHDIKTLTVQVRYSSCFGPSADSKITYHRFASGDLVCKGWTNSKRKIYFADTLPIAELRAGLVRFNEDPYRQVSTHDLGITKADVDSFLADRKPKDYDNDPGQRSRFDLISTRSREFFSVDSAVPFVVDVDRRELRFSINDNATIATLVNTEDDTLTIVVTNKFPYTLYPLSIWYGELQFITFDPSLLYCIGEALPPNFENRYFFTRSSIIDYVTSQRMNDSRD
ncbi:MAG: hypothetical protein IPM83_08920 [Ignavibacteria bacterium]|nr:hypothetical protein [Ignavibacteria bacterium]MBK7411563.1 hypothetical protein [Ignavibacteria bacterium]MBK9183229.1 hypothetical protein [Ignavibacteria bacterium]